MESFHVVSTVGKDRAYEQCLGGEDFQILLQEEKQRSKDRIIQK